MFKWLKGLTGKGKSGKKTEVTSAYETVTAPVVPVETVATEVKTEEASGVVVAAEVPVAQTSTVTKSKGKPAMEEKGKSAENKPEAGAKGKSAEHKPAAGAKGKSADHKPADAGSKGKGKTK